MPAYHPRVVDAELEELLLGAPAVAIEGPKGVGKTATSVRRARTVYAIDDPRQRELLEADPDRVARDAPPVLLDEWQRLPLIWDLVRRNVDRSPEPGRFLLTGSAMPREAPVHSGAGRIVTLRMRPMSLAERDVAPAAVTLASLLAGERQPLEGDVAVNMPAYVEEITASGFPGMRATRGRARRTMLDGYVARVAERDFEEQGRQVRRPERLLAWMRAYAAATATNASYNRILDAATPGEAEKPARSTTTAYRHVLESLWILDPLPSWSPSDNRLARLAIAPKHHLADPALAARLLGVDADALLHGAEAGPEALREGSLVSRLFESLVTQSLRVYAQAHEARVYHLRTRNGDHEVDLIVERGDGSVVALEVKLSPLVGDEDVRHLRWLREKLGGRLLDAAVVTTGRHAYRRQDGIAVIPAALFGP